MESSETSKTYDAIVVGAGMAGMMAATDLNHRGHKVLVLEHNHQPGGLMAGIWRKGFYFDAGCQSFESMNILFPLWKQYGLDKEFEFHRARYRLMMPGIDTIVHTLKQTREDFKRAFPTMADGFDRVFDMHDFTERFIRTMFRADRIPYVQNESRKSFPKWLVHAIPYMGKMKTLMLDDFEDWYKKQLPKSGVRDLLATCGYTRMNVFVASAFWHLWAEDYWYPKGGFQRMFDRWAEVLKERGVEFRFKSTVTALEKEGNRVTGVRTKRDEVFSAKEVVYAADYKKLVHDLVGAEKFRAGVVKRLEGTKHSDPLVSVYLGLNLPIEELRKIIKSSHIFYFPTNDCRTDMDLSDAEAHKKVFLEVTAHCLDDASLAPEGKSSLVVQAFTRCEWNEHWLSKGSLSERSIEYKDLKRKVADQIISVFEGIFPDVRKHIEYQDVGTPLSAYRFTRNHLGGTCGFELNWRNFPFANPLAHTSTPFKNLHAAGHFTVWPGAVPTAGLSGKIASLAAHRRLEARA